MGLREEPQSERVRDNVREGKQQNKEAYDESVFAKNEKREAKRRVERLKREAKALGYVLAPEGAAA